MPVVTIPGARRKTLLSLLLVSSLFMALEASLSHADQTVEISEDSFGCLLEMTSVRGFFVDNLLDDLEATLAVANSESGGSYPPGSVVQLVPGEVMVKLSKDSSPATNDWEFFELDVSSGKTKIAKRGFADVVNRFGGNCFACHAQAAPQWDLICESGHGCAPLPLTRTLISAIQKTDQRCNNAPALSDEEKAALAQLRGASQN